MSDANSSRDALATPSRRAEKAAERPSPAGAAGRAASSRHHPPTSRPKAPREDRDGRKKELFALLGDNAPSLVVAQRPKAGKEAKMRKSELARKASQSKKRWALRRFKNPARQDDLVLTHWVQEDVPATWSRDLPHNADHDTEMHDTASQQNAASSSRNKLDQIETNYPFSQFQAGSGAYSYSNDEYVQHLRDDDWTKDETDYLIDICSAYDLRFTVIGDRYEWPGKQRTIEDLKARYYAICRRLIRSRISTDDIETRQQLLQTYAFDRNREVERKKAIARLFARTPAQLAEEEALYVEARRIEQNEAKFAGQREELLRLLGGWESLQSATPASIAAAGAGLGVPLPGSAAEAEELKRKKRKAEETSSSTPTLTGPAGAAAATALSNKQRAELKQAAFDEQHYIQRFDPTAQPSSKPPYPFLTGTPSTHPPVAPSVTNPNSAHGVYIRSTRLLVPRANLQQRTSQTLLEMVPVMGHRLIFPTAKNCEKWEGLLGAVTAGLELKRQLDKVEMELNALKVKADPRTSTKPGPGENSDRASAAAIAAAPRAPSTGTVAPAASIAIAPITEGA
ncbi:hypothetical protein K437DRAFT_233722 [Tilletiaria anomala UBC 951]|uniref:SWR1-complex protein 4 n=1 Tax=Tilletiaria anomala (strain ATCC 24038 / CBS 436.72 / UBC 951) TaxID=1037660 RepID=A0A066W7J3_TILAU|nr:uncharacterized protein K437DRAFT_233722 [Tilletiaria anomala UBC 951]KDN49912.1 hypothetical protein K437DRAFT_233722 [Tilletiaria anomala UBC 951]